MQYVWLGFVEKTRANEADSKADFKSLERD